MFFFCGEGGAATYAVHRLHVHDGVGVGGHQAAPLGVRIRKLSGGDGHQDVAFGQA